MTAELSAPLRAFSDTLLAMRPELARHVAVVDSTIEIASPTGEHARRIVIWDEEGELGLAFGSWHTHGRVALACEQGAADELDAVMRVALAIVAGEMVIAQEIGGPHDGSELVFDLRAPEALLDELTSKLSPGRVRIASWSGADDREVSLDDLG
ncbi:hypothetical protein [Sandaracinus amylolyticus]|uniref:hypothetical protein n=1 Tax=Sandaracinus amylolyticus TaxID=927083 RepID=UPI001F1D5A3F|nr:hypothetical protein [Sandaracinus amylolyticus]UJR87172.1 Hypothetical protein I5071_92730 [Sandaracinus amylolyticus]